MALGDGGKRKGADLSPAGSWGGAIIEEEHSLMEQILAFRSEDCEGS